MLWRLFVVAKSVKKMNAAKPVVAKPVVKAAVVAKPVVAAPVAAKIATPAPIVVTAEAPKPVAVPVAKPVITPPVAVAAPGAPAPTPIKTPEAIKAPTIAEGKTLMNDTVTKVQETAQKFTADATARATEMFGDVSARAKTAMEKGSKGMEEMVEFSAISKPSLLRAALLPRARRTLRNIRLNMAASRSKTPTPRLRSSPR
jgi:hypothetical protein